MIALSSKVVLIVFATMAWCGLILPYMISSRSDFLVLAGFVLTAFAAVFVILNLAKDIIGMQQMREKENDQ